MTEEARPRFGTPSLTTAICVFLVALFVNLFRWTLVESLTPFIQPLLEIAIGLLFLASIVWSIVHLIRTRRPLSKSALMPVAVNVLTVVIAMFVPFSLLTTELDFRSHNRARMAVVSNVLDGRYESLVRNSGARGDYIALPAQLSYLSTGGGDIIRLHRQNATLIFFFDFRGILDSFSGFVYSSDDSPPRDGDFGGRFAEVERLRKNWFWVTSTN
jgi:hypothetical protein